MGSSKWIVKLLLITFLVSSLITINTQRVSGSSEANYQSIFAELVKEGQNLFGNSYNYQIERFGKWLTPDMIKNARDDRGRTILMACIFYELLIPSTYLSQGGDVNAKDYDGCTALMYEASSRRCHNIHLQELLKAGADVNAQSNTGMTALMALVLNTGTEKKECIQTLIDAGADINAETQDGWTALSIAEYYGYEETADILRSHGATETPTPANFQFPLNPGFIVSTGIPEEFVELYKTVPCDYISPRHISNYWTSYIDFWPRTGEFIVRRSHSKNGSAIRSPSDKLENSQETLLILKAFFPTSYNEVLAMMQRVESEPKINTSFLATAVYDGRKVNIYWELNATILEIQNKGIIPFQPAAAAEDFDVIWTPETTASIVEIPIVNPIKVKYNGSLLSLDTEPIIQNGRLLVPIRPIAEAMGAAVNWDQSTQTAVLTLGIKEVRITIDKKTAYVDGKPVMLDVPAQVTNGRTMVPLRFIGEGLGAKVDWDKDTSTASITYSLITIIPKVILNGNELKF